MEAKKQRTKITSEKVPGCLSAVVFYCSWERKIVRNLGNLEKTEGVKKLAVLQLVRSFLFVFRI